MILILRKSDEKQDLGEEAEPSETGAEIELDESPKVRNGLKLNLIKESIESVKEITAKNLKQKRMDELKHKNKLKEILVYLGYLIVVYLVSFSAINSNFYNFNLAMQKLMINPQNGINFNDV